MDHYFLVDVYKEKDFVDELYLHLSDRSECESISHEKMPTLKEHKKFVLSRPYDKWFFVRNLSGAIVGNVYLNYVTERNKKWINASIYILSRFRSNGAGEFCLDMLFKMCDKVFINVGVRNNLGMQYLEDRGFSIAQHCFVKEL